MTDRRDAAYMRRALQLATNGRGYTSPNPMVGAVIVAPDGIIVGEGWHRVCGGPHAEVNAVASVPANRAVNMHDYTIYVTLEPCSHYGKTPPCAKLLTECGFKRVVVGCSDPNPKVAGRGIAMLREAGIDVTENVLSDQCRLLNKQFITAHTLHRPFVTLKWAQSTDGFMDAVREPHRGAVRFSTPLTSTIVHARRADHQAIAVGARTVLADAPRLDTRLTAGRSPRPVVFDRHKIAAGAPILSGPRDTIYIGDDAPLEDTLSRLFSEFGIISVLVEGGASLLHSFISSGIWDEAYVEVANTRLGSTGSVKAPLMPVMPVDADRCDGNTIFRYIAPDMYGRFSGVLEPTFTTGF